ncbi:caspase-6-like [Achroia grisella]|uniref:caspase-6-like n=1 Tax=Achroia grisella TaxID=688607 RepID=UPI0027D268CD|nr:caspase-6-like [Achroia grisella]
MWNFDSEGDENVEVNSEDDQTIYQDAGAYSPGQFGDQDDTVLSKNDTPPEYAATKTKDEPIPNSNNNFYNYMALSKDASTYELEKFQSSILLIFNHVKFIGHSERLGSEKDVEALTTTFQKLGFQVLPTFTDKTEEEIKTILKEFTSQDLTSYGCIAVAVLTHGQDNGMLLAADVSYPEQMIVDYLKVQWNPSLITKPRIVIIQACRGDGDISGVNVLEPHTMIFRDSVKKPEPYTLPMESDILVLHSCYAGNPAHRTMKGSWFIMTLCEEIDRLACSLDLQSIVTVVKRKVAINNTHPVYNTQTMEHQNNKQMPVSTSTFTRKLFLRKPKKEELDESRGLTQVDCVNIVEKLEETSITSTGCDCSLSRFDSMVECLKKYLNDHRDDQTATDFLALCTTSDPPTAESKSLIIKMVSRHLASKLNVSYLQYLYDHDKETESP